MSTIWLRGRPMDKRAVDIAKFVGFKFHAGSFNGSTTVTRPGAGYDTTEAIPEYLSDLGAAHDVLRILFKDEIVWKKYRDFMHRFYLSNDTFPPDAEQICEGILHAIK